jgi:pimeloyl-ACP methyl ester carboxylesterase
MILTLCRFLCRFFALVLILAAAGPAMAQSTFAPGYPDQVLRGPAAAKGAVIWNHGKARLADISNSPIDPYTEILRQAGWDIFRLNRVGMGDREYEAARELNDAVDRLHKEGYSKVVLAGQSFGAWTSVRVAGQRTDLHAVVLTAPAAYGTWDMSAERMGANSFQRNADYLYDMAEHVNPTRLLVFFFAKDDFDPGGRGPRVDAILSEHHIVHKVIDQPPGLSGHGAGHSSLFTRLYGRCIADFIDPDKDPGKVPCQPASWGQEPTGEVPLPTDVKVVPPDPAVPAALAALSGRWWGWYPNGREVEIIVEKLAPGEASIIYCVGPGSGPKDVASFGRRPAQPIDGAIVSAVSGHPTVTLRPASDGHAAVTWKSANGESSLDAVLSRLDAP